MYVPVRAACVLQAMVMSIHVEIHFVFLHNIQVWFKTLEMKYIWLSRI